MIFHNACKNGNLVLAQQLLIENPFIDISANNEYSFRWACSNGHIEIAKWLYKIKPDIDISANNEYSFRWACFKGQLEVAKWLYKNKSDINISANNDFAFRWACSNGKIDIVKWLYHIKPDIDISANNEFSFCRACYNNQIEVVIWLVSINNNYSFKIIDGKIFYKILGTIPILPEIIYVKKIDECSICIINEIDIITNCKHTFCKSCISEWYNKNNTCPYCRTLLYSFNKVISYVNV